MTVKFRLVTAFSTCSLASLRGNDILGGLRNETKRNRPTLAPFAAFTRFNCPATSTDSIESPGCRVKVEDAVEITAFTPRQAAAIDWGSFRSPTHNSTPDDRRASIFSFELVPRPSAFTWSPRLVSLWQTSLPTRPVAPTTRIGSIAESVGRIGDLRGNSRVNRWE